MKKELEDIIKEFAIEVSLFFLLAFLMGLFWKNNLFLAFVLCVFLVIYHLFCWNIKDFVFSIVVFVFFQIGEIVPSYFGAWTYNNPSYLGVPIWIPFSWACCALVLKNFIRTVDKSLDYIKKVATR